MVEVQGKNGCSYRGPSLTHAFFLRAFCEGDNSERAIRYMRLRQEFGADAAMAYVDEIDPRG